ncbi:hypothetical protein PV05_03923 [Exophiala xenobiotica]|uniref:Uncharacterized protein n=1 Tax=Exophiala xenobiotica TaxID=348802 RepID=A0A0D2C3U9_9EURO|nr:uncharacterized protein PV05_03923 [Exophiala xenobiotica]KIW59476.1 hypothetical protein PV05_03923 [Exophiala xenobiotica]
MVELSRADARAVPNWKDVELKQEGKHRLGYNPATGYREISQEDFETVRASGKAYNTGTNSIRFRRKGGNRAALSKV